MTLNTSLLTSACILMCSSVFAATPTPNALLDDWRILDSRSGVIESVMHFEQEKDGSYSGTVIKSSPNPLIRLYDTCMKCPAPFTDKPIVGMKVLWGFTQDAKDSNRFNDGYAFDPKNGKTYKAKIRISGDQRRMMLRGYIGTPIIGRTEVWLRGDGNLTQRLDSK
jgi:hypothetical protein